MPFSDETEYPRGKITGDFTVATQVVKAANAEGAGLKIHQIILSSASATARTITLQGAGGGTVIGKARVAPGGTVYWPRMHIDPTQGLELVSDTLDALVFWTVIHFDTPGY